ncbi:MAG: aromatic ring-hydroxylating dioxygenase subunit alpha [Pseudomonadota bacterium]
MTDKGHQIWRELEACLALPHGQALTLPFAAYRDRSVFREEMRTVFLTDWLFVCAEQEIPDAGDYYALRVGPEPVVIIRGRDGVARAFANVCRHRGTQLLDDGFGRIDRRMVCPYHAWAYDDLGELQAVPFSKDSHVEREAHALVRFEVSTWRGLLFVSLGDPPLSLEARVAHVDALLDFFDQGQLNAASPGPIELWHSNWKLIMENAMESYHLFKVHTDTLETITPTRGSYYVTGDSEAVLTGGGPPAKADRLPSAVALEQHYLLVSLPPNFVGVLDGESLSWISVFPIDAETSVVRSGGLTSNLNGYERTSTREFVLAFFAEDQAICERVQRSMGATLSRGGRLTEMERVVVNFHHYLGSRLFQQVRTDQFDDEMAAVYRDALA